jgi:hypothetical protein
VESLINFISFQSWICTEFGVVVARLAERKERGRSNAENDEAEIRRKKKRSLDREQVSLAKGNSRPATHYFSTRALRILGNNPLAAEKIKEITSKAAPAKVLFQILMTVYMLIQSGRKSCRIGAY